MTVDYRIDVPVAVLTLNRPEKLNAINSVMIDELHAALDRAEGDERVRAIVLNGAGRAFSSGFDLEVDQHAWAGNRERLRRELQRDFDIIMRFWDSAKPTVAAVHGYCLGSAMEMAVACDITIAAQDCRFGAPEVRFGSGIVSLILPWLIGVKQAKELLLTGSDELSSERALALGLVNDVVSPEALMQAAMSMAQDIAANDRLAVSLTKQAINRSCEIAGMRQALVQALELDVIIEATETDESREFNSVLEERGAKAAIAWRRRRRRGGE